MIALPSARRICVAVLLAGCLAVPRGADARQADAGAAADDVLDGSVRQGDDRRLELAAGRHEGVRPERIAADVSTWLPRAEPADGRDEQRAAITVPTREIVSWGRCPPWPVGPMVLLADGGVIAGRIVRADGETVAVASNLLGRIVLPAGGVRAYRASTAIGPAPAAVEPPPEAGIVRLFNGDRMLVRRIDWGDGRLSGETSFGAATMPADVVRAVDWAADPAAAGRERGVGAIQIALVDGSRLAIDSLAPVVSAGGSFARSLLALASDGSRAAPVTLSCASEAIVALAVEGAAATRLATLEPEDEEQTIVFGREWPMTRGRSLTGDWPELRAATGFSSLGLHAPARVRFRLARPALRFAATVGIDDAAGPGQGSVVVRILAGDAAGGRREAYVSPVLRGGEPPVEVRAMLADAEEIELIVEPADDGPILDRTLWLDPRVIHRPRLP